MIQLLSFLDIQYVLNGIEIWGLDVMQETLMYSINQSATIS